jgi:hypothetical protein
MPALTPKKCTRTGCGKTLREINKAGVCSSGCLSPDAPPAQRATALVSSTGEDVLKRFRRVAKALGKDPDAILDDAMRKVAKQWLETLEAAVQ